MSTAFDAKRPDEVEVFAVDFARRLGTGVTITDASVKAVLESDESEAAIPAMVSGAAGVSGSIVSQLISGGADGVTYTLLFSATTSQSETLIEARDLPVQRDLT